MSELITTAVIVYVVYQLMVVILQKKDPQKGTKKPGSSPRSPGEGTLRELLQETSRENWQEQLKKVLENSSSPAARPTPTVKPRPAAELMPADKPGSLSDYYVPLEGTQGVEGTPGVEGTGDYIGILGPEGYMSDRNTGGLGRGGDSAIVSGVLPTLTEDDLRKGIVWGEILGKPRAIRPFRGSRT